MTNGGISFLACCVAILSTAIALSSAALAAPFNPGDIVVYRVGDGSTSLVNTGSPVFVDEYSPAGSLVHSLEMPTAASGSQNAFFASGTATSEGALTVSPNGKYIALTGYAGMSTPPTSLASSSLPRVVGIVNATTGSIDTSTAPTDFAVGNNPRSAVTTDGTNIWMAGAAGGVRFATIGDTGSSTMVSPSPGASNFRQVNIFGGQLLVDGSSGGSTFGSIGTGVPTSANQPLNLLPGFPQGLSDTVHQNPFSYFFADLSPSVPGIDTLYVADDTTHPSPAAAGGIAKYSLIGGSWTLTGSIDETSSNYRGITGVVQNNGSVTLYSTRGASGNSASGLQIVSLTDSSGYDGTLTATPTVFATAAANEAFRGIGVLSVTGLPGDFNLDGHVNAADISSMEKALTNLNKYQSDNSLSNNSLLSVGDLNGDGIINGADLQFLINELKAGNGSNTAVPEPASFALAGLGFVAIGLAARKKTRKS